MTWHDGTIWTKISSGASYSINVTPYYDQALKRARLARLAGFAQFTAHEFMLEDAGRVADTVAQAAADTVIHLAAQAGVRYSISRYGSVSHVPGIVGMKRGSGYVGY